MIKMCVMKTCPYCEHVEKQVIGEPELKVIDVGENVRDLKEFLRLSDHHPEFRVARERCMVGVPSFLLEDGTVTFNSEEAGLDFTASDVPQGTACSIDGIRS